MGSRQVLAARLLHGKIDCNDVLTGVTVQDLARPRAASAVATASTGQSSSTAAAPSATQCGRSRATTCSPRWASRASWPSPRCSRSSVAACQSLATGSSGTSSARSPAYSARPSVGALTAARVARSATRTRPGESASSPIICRSAAALPRSAWGVRAPVEVSRAPPEPQRRGPAREVSVPVVAHAEGQERLVRHLGEGDGGDRLDELEHAVDLGLWVRHRSASPVVVTAPSWAASHLATKGASIRGSQPPLLGDVTRVLGLCPALRAIANRSSSGMIVDRLSASGAPPPGLL